MRKPVIALALVVILIIGVWILLSRHRVSEEDLQAHRTIESKYAVNPEQRKEIPQPAHGTVPVYRYKDDRGIWQTALEQPPMSAKDSMIIGMLYKSPKAPEVEVPVYLCAYRGKLGPNMALDSSPDCHKHGQPVQAGPAGYVSKSIRTGFILMARCSSPTSGMYPSLNVRCEARTDQWEENLGSIRAAAE
jgi:hypothetical protein